MPRVLAPSCGALPEVKCSTSNQCDTTKEKDRSVYGKLIQDDAYYDGASDIGLPVYLKERLEPVHSVLPDCENCRAATAPGDVERKGRLLL